MFPNPFDIQKGRLGPSAASPETSISAAIGNGVAVAGKLVLEKVYTVRSIDEVKLLGIDAAYDTTNQVVVFRHLDEFFRMAGEGTVLHLMLVPQDVPIQDFVEDPDMIHAKKLLASVEANNEVQQLMAFYNPDVAEYVETLVDGLPSDIRAAFAQAQLLCQWAFENKRPLNILIEGRGISGTPSSALNLRNIPAGADTLEADNVSLVIGQDWDFAESRAWAFGKKYADVGTALGCLASLQMNQSIAEVETVILSDAVKSKWLHAGLSNHNKIEDSEIHLETLDTKGYIFPVKYSGISGYRWNGEHTCTPIKIDAEGRMNEHRISLGRTMNNVYRELYKTIVPEIMKVKQVDPATGFMPLGVVKDMEGKGNDVFEDYSSKGWISGGQMFVDPTSDIQTPPGIVKTQFDVVPTAIVGKLSGFINFKKSI